MGEALYRLVLGVIIRLLIQLAEHVLAGSFGLSCVPFSSSYHYLSSSNLVSGTFSTRFVWARIYHVAFFVLSLKHFLPGRSPESRTISNALNPRNGKAARKT